MAISSFYKNELSSYWSFPSAFTRMHLSVTETFIPHISFVLEKILKGIAANGKNIISPLGK
jgi:hypothetical protein